jgi:hypothetical protein
MPRNITIDILGVNYTPKPPNIDMTIEPIEVFETILRIDADKNDLSNINLKFLIT